MEVPKGGTVLFVGEQKTKPASVDIAAMRKRDHEVIRVRFNYTEHPGKTLRFPFKKYKEDPVIRWELDDGKLYELPFMVISHINNDVGFREHVLLLDNHGRPIKTEPRMVRRAFCESAEFVDFEDMRPIKRSEPKDEVPPLKKS